MQKEMTGHSFDPNSNLGYRNDLNQPHLIRSDIFLIKLNVTKIKIEYQKKVGNSQGKKEIQTENKDVNPLSMAQIGSLLMNGASQNKQEIETQHKDGTPQTKKEINGTVKLKILQKNHFYMSLDQFKKNFRRQLRQETNIPEQTESTPNPIEKSINENYQKLASFLQLNQDEQQEKKKSKQIKKLSKATKQSIFRMIIPIYLASTKQISQFKPFTGYEQTYQLQYKRTLENKQVKKQQPQEEEDETYNIEKIQKTQRHVEETESKSARQELAHLFRQNESLMFSGTMDSVFELKFEEQEFDLEQNGQKSEKPTNSNVFWAKFRLKNFSEIPFTQHQATVKLFQKSKGIESNQKDTKHKEKIEFKVDLSFFFVPGNINGWGVLKIDEISIIWKQRDAKRKPEKRFLKIRLEFPDVIERNKRLIKTQKDAVETKVQQIDNNQNPTWTQDIEMKINPQTNKVRIMLLEMEENKFDVKSIAAEKKIYLLEDGYLFHKVDSERHILLKSKKTQDQEKINVADMIMNFCFEMSEKDDQVVPEKLTENKNNTFVNHFSTLS